MTSAENLPTHTGQPTSDEVYENSYRRLVRELLDQRRLGAAFEQGVVQCFRKAPVALCSRAIGRWINRRLREARLTQEDLGRQVGVDRSAVAYWIGGGAITLANLAQVLIALRAAWTDLPIPARQELAVAAYVAALGYTREQLYPERGRLELTAEGFWSLFHLFSTPCWERGVRRQDPELLGRETDRVREAVAASLGGRPAAVTVESLRQLVRDWGVAWMVCLGQSGEVRPRWAVQ